MAATASCPAVLGTADLRTIYKGLRDCIALIIARTRRIRVLILSVAYELRHSLEAESVWRTTDAVRGMCREMEQNVSALSQHQHKLVALSARSPKVYEQPLIKDISSFVRVLGKRVENFSFHSLSPELDHTMQRLLFSSAQLAVSDQLNRVHVAVHALSREVEARPITTCVVRRTGQAAQHYSMSTDSSSVASFRALSARGARVGSMQSLVREAEKMLVTVCDVALRVVEKK